MITQCVASTIIVLMIFRVRNSLSHDLRYDERNEDQSRGLTLTPPSFIFFTRSGLQAFLILGNIFFTTSSGYRVRCELPVGGKKCRKKQNL